MGLLIGMSACNISNNAIDNLATTIDNKSEQKLMQKYKDYFDENYAKENCNVFLADLTHDGVNDMVVVEILKDTTLAPINNVDEYNYIRINVLHMGDNGMISSIYENDAKNIHSGWLWLYLYEEDGKDYLLQYSPNLLEGVGNYHYNIFSLGGNGEQIIYKSDQVDFKLDTTADESAIRKRIEDLQARVDNYSAKSKVLIELGEESFLGKTYFNYTKSSPDKVFQDLAGKNQ